MIAGIFTAVSANSMETIDLVSNTEIAEFNTNSKSYFLSQKVNDGYRLGMLRTDDEIIMQKDCVKNGSYQLKHDTKKHKISLKNANCNRAWM